MLLDNRVIDDIRLVVRGQDFYHDKHQKMFAAMLAIFDAGKPVTPVGLGEYLREKGWLADCGGAEGIYDLVEKTPTAVNADYYAKIVHGKAVLRGIIRQGNEMVKAGYDPSMPAEQLLEQIERQVLALAEEGLDGDGEKTASEVVTAVWDRIDARKRSDRPVALPTGLQSLDEILIGLHPAEMIVVAARPSVGKTTVGLRLAIEAAYHGHRPAYYISLEQPAAELFERGICSIGRIDSQALKQDRLSPTDWETIQRIGHLLRQAPLHLADGPSQSVSRIAARSRRLRRRGMLDLLVVDYLQLVEPESRRDPRHEQVGQMSRRFKLLARELEVPVVVLAQLNREVENRTGQKPRLSDLRESGAIEADADVVLLLHEPDKDAEDLDVIVAKNRNGPKGEVRLLHEKPTGWLTDPSSDPFVKA